MGTKGKAHFNNPSTFRCRFVYVCNTFSGHQKTKKTFYELMENLEKQVMGIHSVQGFNEQ